MAEAKPAAHTPGSCPMCGRPSTDRYRPFCSRRCADVDLSRWLRGTYAIPDRDEDDAAAGKPPPREPEPE
jgi:uncharacterized protein